MAEARCRRVPTARALRFPHHARVTLVDFPATIAFDRWRFAIQIAMDVDTLMLVVAAYQSGWRAEDRAHVPDDLAAPVDSPEELHSRAVGLVRADAQFSGKSDEYPYLRELTLTISFAVNRLRYLQSLKVQI